MHMQIEPIGVVRSCFKAKFGTPRQGKVVPDSQGYIEIHKKWEPLKSLKSLDSFSHVWVLFWFHENTNLGYLPMVKPPRLSGKTVGVFASRSPCRPNPIGLSLVKIERIEGERLYISGIDLIEGTPVLDIKPYIHDYDSAADARSGWLEGLEESILRVEFSEEAQDFLASYPNPKLKSTLTDILCGDIRNRSDKRDIRSGKSLGFYYEDLNVVFQVKGDLVWVIQIEPSRQRASARSMPQN